MARASTYTLLSLDRFCQLLGMNPLHFNQVVVENKNVDNDWSCGGSVAQYGWQAAGRVGREEIAIAIAQAEASLATVLKYDVAPTWRVQDLAIVNNQQDWWRGAMGPTVKLPYGYVLYGGIEKRTSIGTATMDDDNMAYASKWGSDYKETVTITMSVPTGTAPGDVCLYYPGMNLEDAWEIRPIQVAIDPLTDIATITCKREQLVKPEIQEDALSWNEVDGLEDENFLTSVEVATRSNDPSRQLDLIWSPQDVHYNAFGMRVCATCGDSVSGCAECTESTASGCFTVRDRRLGTIQFVTATWDTDLGSYIPGVQPAWNGGVPNKVLAYYRAGFYDPNVSRPMWTISPKLEKAVFMLAMTNLARPICGCADIKDLHGYYNTDFAEVSSDPSGSLSYQQGLESNPFGTKRGAIEAFKAIRQGLALGGGVNVYGR